MSDDKIKLTGLWRNTSANGEEYFSGSLGSAKVLVFGNRYKETDKHPDLIMYLAPGKKRDEVVETEQATDSDDLPFDRGL